MSDTLSRRSAREHVLQALYAFELGQHTTDHVIQHQMRQPLKSDRKILDFALHLFDATIASKDEMDGLITRHIQNWDFKRIAWIDKLILRMSLAELVSFPDIPEKVTINEAIELGKRFSTPDSWRFINGILDAARKELISENRIQKKGRGLNHSTSQSTSNP
jgi:N utilization substance protein B